MHLWMPAHLDAIGNFFGEFVAPDLSFKSSGVMMVACILVKIDLKLGLSTYIQIQPLSCTFTQILDYKGVPFWCHHFHAYGHLLASCSLPFREKDSCLVFSLR